MIIQNVTSKIAIIWFASLFTLASPYFKYKIEFINIAPATLIPVAAFLISSNIQKAFFSEFIKDKNFKYVFFISLIFIFLMMIQTILSDWQNDAQSELLKTTLFYFLTHVFFSIFIVSNNLYISLRVSLIVTIFFVLYLINIYFLKFEVNFIGNLLLDFPTKAGRNTLALFISLSYVFLIFLIIHDNNSIKKKIFNYLSLFFFITIIFLIGSKLGVIFFFLFTIIIIITHIKSRIKKTSFFKTIIVLLTLFVVLNFLLPNLQNLYSKGFFSSLSRLLENTDSESNISRIDLFYIGLECFYKDNIIFGNGVKNYFNCTVESSINSKKILHNDHLSILNNVGLFGYFLWLTSIIYYSKLLNITRKNYIFRSGLIIFLLSLLVIDAYNSPIFALILALSRWEWHNNKINTY